VRFFRVCGAFFGSVFVVFSSVPLVLPVFFECGQCFGAVVAFRFLNPSVGLLAVGVLTYPRLGPMVPTAAPPE